MIGILNTLKLSVLDLIPVFPGTSPTSALEQAVLLAQTAERSGYNRYWVAEHHDMELLACSSPEVVLSHIGAKTERIRLGSGAVLLPHYKPIKVAETFNLLAALYPGRIDLGLGRAPGGSAHLSMALSGNFLENVRQLPHTIGDLLKLLTNEYELEGVRVTARPFPPVPPEVWMLGTNNRSASYAAEFGTGYVFGQHMSDMDAVEVLSAYRQQFRPSKLCSEPKVIVAIGVICAETEKEARELALQGAMLFRSRDEADDHTDDTSTISSDPVLKNPKCLVGSPQQIIAQLVKLQQKYGTDEFLIVNSIPDYEKRLRSYSLLAEGLRDF